MKKNIGVAVIGDVLDIDTWSNTPWYFYQEGQRQGLFNQPWRLNMSQFRTPRLLWNLKQKLTGKGVGGYQYSESFLDRAESSIDDTYLSSTVIAFNQLFPRAHTILSHGGQIYYYIDITLEDLFKEASYGVKIPEHVKQKALSIEKKNYDAAAGVVTMASWVTRSLRDFYKIDPKKIHTIMPGANLPTGSTIDRTTRITGGAGVTRDFVLGFVGKDWRRKGLLTVLDTRDELEQRGYKVKVKVIGAMPADLSGRRGVEYSGFINKKDNHQEFIRELASCDVGCLFSEAEALGISVLEFLSLGVPVIGFAHQGTLDTLLPGATLRFKPSDTPAGIAAVLTEYINDHDKFLNMQRKASEVSKTVTWQTTIEKWSTLLK